MHLISLISLIFAAQLVYFAFMTGMARGKHGVKAPATSGNEAFEQVFRAQQNSLEQAIPFLVTLWGFAYYTSATAAAVTGAIFVLSRFWFFAAYSKDPASRSKAFMIGFLTMVVQFIGAMVGLVGQLI